jgi:hypothetical protein
MCLVCMMQMKTFWVLYNRRKVGVGAKSDKPLQLKANTRDDGVEMRLLFNAFALFIAMSMKVVFYICVLYASEYINDIYMFATDTFSLISPVLLVISSKYVRHMLFDFIVKRQKYNIM